MERQKTWFYVSALLAGAWIGLAAPEWGNTLHYAMSPILAVLLYSMFLQIPFMEASSILDESAFYGCAAHSQFYCCSCSCMDAYACFSTNSGCIDGCLSSIVNSLY